MRTTSSERIAVIGHPVSHSLSPVIHGAAFTHLGIDATYDKLDVNKDEVPRLVHNMRQENFRQFAVTIPNKEVALETAQTSSDIARYIGAANTLTRLSDESIHADNTDWVGVRDSLTEVGVWKNKKALILGAGGAARGTIHALQALGAVPFIRNRTPERAEVLMKHFGIEWGEEGGDYDLIVNTTPLGLKKNDDPENVNRSAINTQHLHEQTTVFDTVMNPLETTLLRHARENGCKTVDGLRMLVYQGIEQLRLWTETIDPKLSQKVIEQRRELAEIMRAAALNEMGVTDTNS